MARGPLIEKVLGDAQRVELERAGDEHQKTAQVDGRGKLGESLGLDVLKVGEVDLGQLAELLKREATSLADASKLGAGKASGLLAFARLADALGDGRDGGRAARWRRSRKGRS